MTPIHPPQKKSNKKTHWTITKMISSRFFRSKQNSFPPAGHLGHLDLWRVFWWHLESFAVDGNEKSGRLVGWEVEGGSLSHHLPGLMHPKWWFSPDFWTLPSTKWQTLNKQIWGWISRLEGTEINPPKMAMNLLLSQYRFPWDEDDRFVFLHLTQNF